jgi:integrase
MQHILGNPGVGRQVDKLRAFFVSDRGEPLPKRTAHGTFENLRTGLRWIARGHAAPRIHDRRHTFICRSLLDCYHRN